MHSIAHSIFNNNNTAKGEDFLFGIQYSNNERTADYNNNITVKGDHWDTAAASRPGPMDSKRLQTKTITGILTYSTPTWRRSYRVWESMRRSGLSVHLPGMHLTSNDRNKDDCSQRRLPTSVLHLFPWLGRKLANKLDLVLLIHRLYIRMKIKHDRPKTDRQRVRQADTQTNN